MATVVICTTAPNRSGAYKGKSPIKLRVTIKGKPRYIHLGEYIEPQFWNKEKECVKNLKSIPRANQINASIAQKKVDVIDAITEFQRCGRILIFEDLISYLDSSVRELLTQATLPKSSPIFLEYCDRVMKREKVQRKTSTNVNYKSRLVGINEFSPGIRVHEITDDWFYGYKEFLLETKGLEYNTIISYFKCINKFLGNALDEELIHKNPKPKNFSLEYAESKKDYLDLDELLELLDLFESKKLLKVVKKDKRGKVYPIGTRMQYILQHFLIGCFTGLRGSDLKKLSPKHINHMSGCITITMKKGLRYKERQVKIPITSYIKRVLDIYNTVQLYEGSVVVGSKTNNTIREIIRDYSSIKNKHIHLHCARHTFGTTAVTLGIPLETVQVLMGHSNIKTTQKYANIVASKIKEDMTCWERLNTIGPLKHIG